MGWKNVKEHYRIVHTVQVTDAGICIGSQLCHDLIVINTARQKIVKADVGRNDELTRYKQEMEADLDKLWTLVDAGDTFSANIPVYTWKDAEIVEELCEATGYPNVTHDGHLMYDNRYSTDRDQVLQWAIEIAVAGVRIGLRRIEEMDIAYVKARKLLEEDQADLAKLRHEQIMSRLGGTPKKEESE